MISIKELRARIERERQAQSDRRRPRFSADLKRLVKPHGLAARGRGVSESQLLADLGIGPASLIRWCGHRDKSHGFRQVAMVRATKSIALHAPVSSAQVAVANRSLPVAIIGLTVSELIELCRSLGC